MLRYYFVLGGGIKKKVKRNLTFKFNQFYNSILRKLTLG